MARKYVYFISMYYSDLDSGIDGWSNCDVWLDNKISGIEDIRYIEKKVIVEIYVRRSVKVSIQNYKLMGIVDTE